MSWALASNKRLPSLWKKTPLFLFPQGARLAVPLRGKGFPSFSHTKPCSFAQQAFPSLPIQSAFLFCTRQDLLPFPQTRPSFSSKKKRFLVPPKRHVLYCTRKNVLPFPDTKPSCCSKKERLLVPPTRDALFLPCCLIMNPPGHTSVRRGVRATLDPTNPAFKLRVPSRLSPPPTDDPDLVYLSFAPL